MHPSAQMNEETVRVRPRGKTGANVAWRLIALIAFIGVLGFHAWTLHSSRGMLSPQKNLGDYYNLLVDGFQAGHLHMQVDVDPALLALPPEQRPGNAAYLLDASLYQGRYYLYFGVVPAVLLHWPFSAITGYDLPDALGSLVLASSGLLFGVLWWREMRRQFLRDLGPRVDWLVIFALGVGTAIPSVLRRPLFYEEAALAGWTFGAIMLWALVRAYRSPHGAGGWLAVAGTACGLAAGSRANLVLAGVAALAVGAVLVGRRSGRGFKRGLLPAVLFAAAGALPVGAGLAGYNHARFGSITEFGHSHQLGMNPQRMFRVSNLTHNLGIYYGQPPEINAYFPYVLPPAEESKPPDYIGRESAQGEWIWLVVALTAAPVVWLARRSPMLWGLMPAGVWFAGNLLVTGSSGIRANRYMLDFHPALVGATLVGIGWVIAESRGRWRVWRTALVLLVALAVFFNGFASFQVHGFFAERDPVGFRRLATAGDRVLWRAAPWVFRDVGARETEVRWPPRGEGGVMRVLTAGVPEFQDELWVRLDGHSRASFETKHGDYGSVLGPEFDYEPGASVSLRLAGAFMDPPPWHEWYGAHSADERMALKRRLRLWVDGTVVFDRDVPSFSSAPWLQTWGELQQGPLRRADAPTDWTKHLTDRAGMVRLRIRLPSDRFGSAEPLAQMGSVTAWDVVMLRFPRPGQVQVVHDSMGGGAVASEEFAVDYDEMHTVEIETPAANDGLAWNRNNTLDRSPVEHVSVRWNGRPVLGHPRAPHASEMSSLAIGLNDRASGCRVSYAGELRAGPFLGSLSAPRAAGWRCRPAPAEFFVGLSGVLIHWRSHDGRDAALVWRRDAPGAPVQLGWLDNGLIVWAPPLPDDQPGELRFGIAPGSRTGRPNTTRLEPFRLGWNGSELIEVATDFFAEPGVSGRALNAPAWIAEAAPEIAVTEASPTELPGRIAMYFSLPADGLGQSVPLLCAGRAGRADSVYLRPVGDGTYVFGLDHWGVASFESRPVALPPAHRLKLTIEMGSLFSNGEFPADQVRLRLDGEVVLERQTALHRVQAAEVEFGRNTIGFSTSTERFPGEIYSVQRHAP